MKGWIYKDERWPDYGISSGEPNSTEIPDELYARYEKVSVEYDAVQDELQKIYEEQSK